VEGGCGGSGSHLGARIAVEGGGGSPGSRLGATEVVVGGGGSLAREGGGGRAPVRVWVRGLWWWVVVGPWLAREVVEGAPARVWVRG